MLTIQDKRCPLRIHAHADAHRYVERERKTSTHLVRLDDGLNRGEHPGEERVARLEHVWTETPIVRYCGDRVGVVVPGGNKEERRREREKERERESVC